MEGSDGRFMNSFANAPPNGFNVAFTASGSPFATSSSPFGGQGGQFAQSNGQYGPQPDCNCAPPHHHH